jgi:hypothetical protein
MQHRPVLAIIASMLLASCGRTNSGQVVDRASPAVSSSIAESSEPNEATASLAVQLVDLEGRRLERQSLALMPLAEGYSDLVERGPFWANLAGEVIVDSLVPGTYRFVINQQWPKPTFLEFIVGRKGLATDATVLQPEIASNKPDLNVDIALRTGDGAKTASLLDVTVFNNTGVSYSLRPMDPQLVSVDYRVFPPAPHEAVEVPPRGKGKLALTLDWDAYRRQGLWCSKKAEDVEWKGPVAAAGVIYFRVGIGSCYSLPVPLHVPADLTKRGR